MNDKERDRSGDGAGPVANEVKIIYKTPFRSTMMLTVFLFLSFIPVFGNNGSYSRLRGLSLTVDVGVMRPDNYHANFYNGNPRNVNTLNRILYSETYGNSIWNNLTNQNLIGSSVGSYNQITVAEYGDMYYKLAFQLGMGFRYDLENPYWAWQIGFDYAKLHAQGLVLLNSGHNTTFLTNQNAYVNCPTLGVEERIYINLGVIRKFRFNDFFDFEFSLGGNVNNTKVESSDISIGGITYSILDVWGGQSPSSYVMPYEYVNQGGIGYGGYVKVALGFTLPIGTAMNLSYAFHYNKVVLEGYQSFAPHHIVSLNVALNNFSFFDS